MQIINLNSFKVSPKLPLGKISSYFNIHRPLVWKDYILLEGSHLDMIFKYDTGARQIYLFEFGCAVFIDFSLDEIRYFLDFIKSLADKIDNDLFTSYYESHTLEIDEKNMCYLWKVNTEPLPYTGEILSILSLILAKSTALSQIEADTANLLNEAEGFISYLQKGKLRANTKRFASAFSKVLRFEFQSINSIGILDRLVEGNENTMQKEIYDLLAEYYELNDRYQIIQSKIYELKDIVNYYSTLSYNNNEKRLLIFEIFLLALFPLSHAAAYIIEKLL